MSQSKLWHDSPVVKVGSSTPKNEYTEANRPILTTSIPNSAKSLTASISIGKIKKFQVNIGI